MKFKRASAVGAIILCAPLGVMWAFIDLRPTATGEEAILPIEVPEDHPLETTPELLAVSRMKQAVSAEPGNDVPEVIVLDEVGRAVDGAELWKLGGAGVD